MRQGSFALEGVESGYHHTGGRDMDAVQRIRRHVKAGDRQRFQEDEVLQSAVLRWFEIIGEAARGAH
jgi:hypothetical protein